MAVVGTIHPSFHGQFRGTLPGSNILGQGSPVMIVRFDPVPGAAHQNLDALIEILARRLEL